MNEETNGKQKQSNSIHNKRTKALSVDSLVKIIYY